MPKLSTLEQDVLAVCGGYVRRLKYDSAQVEATQRLEDLGLIHFCMDEDQPTHYTTPKGDAMLRRLVKSQAAG